MKWLLSRRAHESSTYVLCKWLTPCPAITLDSNTSTCTRICVFVCITVWTCGEEGGISGSEIHGAPHGSSDLVRPSAIHLLILRSRKFYIFSLSLAKHSVKGKLFFFFYLKDWLQRFCKILSIFPRMCQRCLTLHVVNNLCPKHKTWSYLSPNPYPSLSQCLKFSISGNDTNVQLAKQNYKRNQFFFSPHIPSTSKAYLLKIFFFPNPSTPPFLHFHHLGPSHHHVFLRLVVYAISWSFCFHVWPSTIHRPYAHTLISLNPKLYFSHSSHSKLSKAFLLE